MDFGRKYDSSLASDEKYYSNEIHSAKKYLHNVNCLGVLKFIVSEALHAYKNQRSLQTKHVISSAQHEHIHFVQTVIKILCHRCEGYHGLKVNSHINQLIPFS